MSRGVQTLLTELYGGKLPLMSQGPDGWSSSLNTDPFERIEFSLQSPQL